MTTATATKPVSGQKKTAKASGQKKPRKPTVKRTMVEYREGLFAKKTAMQLKFAQAIGKIDARIAKIDEKYKAKVDAFEARKAALAEGKTEAQLLAENVAKIKELQLLNRIIKKL